MTKIFPFNFRTRLPAPHPFSRVTRLSPANAAAAGRKAEGTGAESDSPFFLSAFVGMAGSPSLPGAPTRQPLAVSEPPRAAATEALEHLTFLAGVLRSEALRHDLDRRDHARMSAAAARHVAGEREGAHLGGRRGNAKDRVRTAGLQGLRRQGQARDASEPVRGAPGRISAANVQLVGLTHVHYEASAAAIEVPLEVGSDEIDYGDRGRRRGCGRRRGRRGS